MAAYLPLRLFETHQFLGADRVLAAHSYGGFATVRTWLGYEWSGLESPQYLLFSGIGRAAAGEYEQAQRLFLRARIVCEEGSLRLRLSPWVARQCTEVIAESFIRSGDVFVRQRNTGAYTQARSQYRSGLLAVPLDRGAKEALEWILAFEEWQIKDKGDRSLGGGSKIARDNPLFLSPEPPSIDSDKKDGKGY